MPRPSRLAALAAAIALTLTQPSADALADEQTYVIDAGASTMEVAAYAAGLLSGLAHDHTIAVPDLAGAVRFDASNPRAARVELRIDAAGLRVEDDVDEDDRQEIKQSMDEEVLEVGDHPLIAFTSTGVEVLERRGERLVLEVTGELQLHGRTRAHTLKVEVAPAGGGAIVCSGRTELRQTDYGIEPYSALLGALAVEDVVELTFRITARPQR